MITMGTEEEYLEWKNDPVAQQEYTNYLLERKIHKEQELSKIIDPFTCKFKEPFKEIS